MPGDVDGAADSVGEDEADFVVCEFSDEEKTRHAMIAAVRRRIFDFIQFEAR